MIELDQGGRARKTAVGGRVNGAAGLLVESAWMVGPVRAHAGDAGGWRVVADAHPHVLVVRFPGGGTRARLVGPRSTWVDVDQVGRAWTVGVRLRPGALPALAGRSAHEMVDRGVAVGDLPDDGARRLADTLAGADRPAEALAAVLAWIEALVRAGAGRPDWKVRGLVTALEAGPRRRLGDVAEELGVASRTLRDVARRAIGLSPKRTQRVLRLQRALLLAAHPDAPDGGVVAARSGYADQAHWVNDCTDLLGEPPGAFLARGADPYMTVDPPSP